jgi:hypothetical protein
MANFLRYIAAEQYYLNNERGDFEPICAAIMPQAAKNPKKPKESSEQQPNITSGKKNTQ